MLLLDLAHLRMPALRELMQTVIDFAPDAGRARHFAVHRRVEQTPQALLVEGAEEALHEQHDDAREPGPALTSTSAPTTAHRTASSTTDTMERAQMMFMF